MYAKFFMALDDNGRLTGTSTTQISSYDRYTCHICGSTLRYHPEYDTVRPWFEHTVEELTKNGQQHCPYVKPDRKEKLLIRQLQSYVPDAYPLVFQSDWHCNDCNRDYHGECYCLACQTGEYSPALSDTENWTEGVTACAY
ncbi:zinc-ribbon domain-containing protein [Rosenbergiella metrosideri]|uniref:zinc-ribbon domain-containing protein n=1 Tax=Rosenbergiella metrosideri TaxID=2921185 RepID=UPI001F4FE9A6|nr:zinc-ribbon domain-containing protein [Rosenbergiella metrosideri]